MKTLAVIAIAFVAYAAVVVAILAVGGKVGLGYVVSIGGLIATAVGLVERVLARRKRHDEGPST